MRGLVIWGESALPGQAPAITPEEQGTNHQTVLRALERLLDSQVLTPQQERTPSVHKPGRAHRTCRGGTQPKSPEKAEVKSCAGYERQAGASLWGQGASCTPLAARRMVTTTNHSVSYFQTYFPKEKKLGVVLVWRWTHPPP